MEKGIMKYIALAITLTASIVAALLIVDYIRVQAANQALEKAAIEVEKLAKETRAKQQRQQAENEKRMKQQKIIAQRQERKRQQQIQVQNTKRETCIYWMKNQDGSERAKHFKNMACNQ